MWKRLSLFCRSLSFQLHFASANKSIFLFTVLICLTAIIPFPRFISIPFMGKISFMNLKPERAFFFISKAIKKNPANASWIIEMAQSISHFFPFSLSLWHQTVILNHRLFLSTWKSLFRFALLSRCRAPIIFKKTVELQLCSVHFNFIMFN